MKLYDKEQIDWKNILFDNKTLFWLLLPIIIEQFLNSLMGMVDTMMVTAVGSEAISAVALVDSINNLVIQIFAAMASGAAIVCSQYIGSGNKKESSRSAGQVVLTVFVISLSITAFCITGGERLLRLIFGTVEDAVMENALVYFIITAVSYPFLALFSNSVGIGLMTCGRSVHRRAQKRRGKVLYRKADGRRMDRCAGVVPFGACDDETRDMAQRHGAGSGRNVL